jgi:hypothetical protein
LLRLANFPWTPFVLDLFGEFIPKGENVGPKQASVSRVGRGKLCEHRKSRSKRGKFDLGGVWVMVSIQASVISSNLSNSENLCLIFLCCHKSPKRSRL